MEWYWYLTGVVTAIGGMSVIVNLLMINGTLKITSVKQRTTRMHMLYDWSNDSGPISRAS